MVTNSSACLVAMVGGRELRRHCSDALLIIGVVGGSGFSGHGMAMVTDAGDGDRGCCMQALYDGHGSRLPVPSDGERRFGIPVRGGGRV